ncbi:hypothetical protein JL722_11109 [Aureococcus anophagefferens]|nr:hypothetical protein JL722_11109 [Aureococcus anophagefferens]
MSEPAARRATVMSVKCKFSKTEAECFRLNVLACRYSKRAAIDLAGIRAGTRLAVYNINEKHARGFMTATSGAQRGLIPGAFGGKFDYQVAAAFAYYATRRSFDVRGFLSFHTHRKNEYPPLEEFAWRDKITIVNSNDRERDNDDRYIIRYCKEHHCSFVTDDNLRGWEDRLGGEDAAFLQIFRNDLHIMYVFVAGEFLPDKPPWEFLRAGEALPAPAPHTARDAAAAEAALWAARSEPVVACRPRSADAAAGDRRAHLRRAGGDDVPRRARGLRAARAGAARARDLPGLRRRRRAAPRRRRRLSATLEGLRFEPGEIVGVLDLGDHHAMVLDAASGAGATLFERATAVERHFSCARRRRAVAGDDLGRAGTYLRACSSRAGAPRRGRERAGARQLVGPPRRRRRRRDAFEDADLVDQSEVMPYKGQRLLRPVRLEGSSKVYSYAAVAEGFGAGEGGWADTLRAVDLRPDPAMERALARHAGKDALLLTAAAARGAAPAARRPRPRRDLRARLPGPVVAAPRRDARRAQGRGRAAARAPLRRVGAPRGLRVLRHDAGGQGRGRRDDDGALHLQHPHGRCAVEATSSRRDATLGPKRLPLAGAGGVAVRSATLIIVDCSESMGGEFRRYEDEKGDVDAYENPEVRVRGLELDDASPEKTAVDALPEALRRRVKKTKPDKLKRDDSRGKVGSFSGTVFVKFASVEDARAALRAPAARGRVRVVRVFDAARLTGGDATPEDMGSLVSLCSSADFVAAAEADRPAKLNADASLKDLALATSAASAVARSGARKLERSPGAGHGRRHCRLMRDLAEASRDADKREIRVFSCEDQLDVWRALIAAPAYSDWARGAFELCVAFGDGYLHEPPTVTFVTPILHPNVDARTGRACHAILGTAWHSEMRALDVIVAVRSLLMAPEPSDALDQSVALRFRDKKNWAEEVKEHVKEHASRSLDELQEAVDADDDADDDDDDDGSGPVCPLTQARARVPVCAPSGRYDGALREAWAAAGDLPHDPVMTEAAGETVILDPLMLDFCPVARPEDKRIAQLRIAEADAADAADASDSDDDAAAAITTPAPVEDPLAMWRCYCCERPIMRLEVVACPTCRLATYCSETCCADHAGDHAHFCRPREIAKDDDVVATAEAGLAEAVAALQRGDAPGCRTEVLAALDAVAGALPPSAFLSADAFNIPDKIRGLFFDLNNLGAKAEQILGGSDARFESTLAAMGAKCENRSQNAAGNRSSRLDAHWASFTAVGPAVCVAQSM